LKNAERIRIKIKQINKKFKELGAFMVPGFQFNHWKMVPATTAGRKFF